ncbi:hypothetical protein [Acinetobacter sp. YH12124]|uniref:hypothetical protein n=1 Tax=Acinetobacter sp. YH12124 TaxID=2601109 RepID=UPI0015D19039|nr:hypothetical protein [Acinetobacter sp. YH12124]
MATDVDVQYFSHLNGLTLGNNWGDLIRLLDKALVTGIDFTQITTASIDAQGDVHITLYAAHNAMLFQLVELSGFTPASLNQKYRIKGVPSETELILKPHTAIVETSITTVGAGKLASLGYEIIFRDANDVKRVYRAKNPTAQHPFIRVDESLTSPDGTTGVYSSAYAKFAMVGLLEHMEHIDDCANLNIQQLPFDSADSMKNWKITGTGAEVIRGWSKWYFSTAVDASTNIYESTSPSVWQRAFTVIGDADAFYFHAAKSTQNTRKLLYGCGLLNSSDNHPEFSWFLATSLHQRKAGENIQLWTMTGGMPLCYGPVASSIFARTFNQASPVQPHIAMLPIIPDYTSGYSAQYTEGGYPALEIPLVDGSRRLRGTLKHVLYSGKIFTPTQLDPYISDSSMYISDTILINTSNQIGNVSFYLGELE